MYCAKCGRRYGSSIKACATCGDALQSKASKRKPSVNSEIRRPERRPLTGLFCDLVNSVGLSLELDAEEMMQIIDAYHKLCDEIVADHGGYLESFMGDGVLAYFGYPRANEDDATNAVTAGLAIIEAIGRIKVPRETPLHARVGIATGLVVVSDRVQPPEQAVLADRRRDAEPCRPAPIRGAARDSRHCGFDPARDTRRLHLS